MKELHYFCGLLNGRQQYYRKDGSLKKTVNYLYDTKQGKTKYFNEQGKLTKTETFYNGQQF